MNNKQDIIRLIKWGIILIIVILLLKECGSTVNQLIKLNKPKSDTVTIHEIDTIYPPKDTVYKFPHIKIPTPHVVHDTIVIGGKDSCTNIKIYEDSLVDKNVSIYYKDYVSQGTLLGKDLSYKLKVPLTIIDSKTVTVNVPKLYPPVFQINAGLTVGSNLFAPKVGVSYKRHTISAGYNLVNKQPIIGYSFVLFRK